MEQKKASWKWKGKDDHLRPPPIMLDGVYIQPADLLNAPLSGPVVLESQRIRTFIIEYTNKESELFL